MPFARTGKRVRPEVRAEVDRLRVSTRCAHCGGGPVEWHNREHEQNRNRRVAMMVSQGYRLDDVLAEIRARLAALLQIAEQGN